MSLPYARTYDEAYLYISLRPCVCGETEFEDRVWQSMAAGGQTGERISGHCANCGRYREFTFEMPEEPRELSFEVQYGAADEPSRLIDPGEWLGIAELYVLTAQDRLDAGDLTEDEDITRVYYLLTSALAAVEETMKFIPPDADSVPEGAFWSQAGRLVFESAPERFGRARLDQQREQLRERVVEFEDKYGTDEDEKDDEQRQGVGSHGHSPPRADATPRGQGRKEHEARDTAGSAR